MTVVNSGEVERGSNVELVAVVALLLSSPILIIKLLGSVAIALRGLWSATAHVRPRVRALLGWVAIAGFLAFGPLMLWWTAKEWRMSEAAQGWPTTEGRITSSSVQNKGGGEFPSYYEINIRYEYLVEGQAYTGDKMLFGRQRFDREKDAEATRGKYLPTAKVPVYFNPASPDEATLQLGFGGFHPPGSHPMIIYSWA